jgi:hypothetical protein
MKPIRFSRSAGTTIALLCGMQLNGCIGTPTSMNEVCGATNISTIVEYARAQEGHEAALSPVPLSIEWQTPPSVWIDEHVAIEPEFKTELFASYSGLLSEATSELEAEIRIRAFAEAWNGACKKFEIGDVYCRGERMGGPDLNYHAYGVMVPATATSALETVDGKLVQVSHPYKNSSIDGFYFPFPGSYSFNKIYPLSANVDGNLRFGWDYKPLSSVCLVNASIDPGVQETLVAEFVARSMGLLDVATSSGPFELRRRQQRDAGRGNAFANAHIKGIEFPVPHKHDMPRSAECVRAMQAT